ncbi:MAG: aminotransferase class IV [Micrococcales bacterium]|nr:aminotransferase class IV [Micrococcales bacterium]
MSFSDGQAIMWVDGDLVPAGQATIPALDHGLTVGDGVFEAVKVRGGKAFALRPHLARMARSAAGLRLPFPGEQAVDQACQAVLNANASLLVNSMAILRITLTAGVGEVGSGRISGASPRLLITLTHHAPRPPTTSCITVPWQRNTHGALTGLKTTSYAENALALAMAREANATEALFANSEGQLCEGTGSNVFLVLDGRLLTPPLSDGLLGGITRQLVLDWSNAVEESVPMQALFEASEVFLTSTGRDVQGVTAIDSKPVSDAALGPVTAQVAQVFAEGEAKFDDS